MQRHTRDDANGSNAGLAIAPPVVYTLDDGTLEQKSRELEW
jgi:hypothetical protein